MTKEEFIAGYCERSGVSWETLSKFDVALPCACGDETCDGWAMVSNNEHSIKAHMELYAPIEDVPNARNEGRAALSRVPLD